MSEQSLRRLHEHVLASVSDGVHVIALDGTVLVENEASARMLGWCTECLVGKHGHKAIHHHHENGSPHLLEECPIFLTARDGVPRHVHDDVFWRADGTCFPVEYSTAPLLNDSGERYGVAVVFRDTSERRRRDAELHRMAHFDALTGLPNRALFADRVDIALAQAQRNQHAAALIYIDLDGFKPVNDRHGHGAGDALLKAVAERLGALLRGGDTLARIGGDEFVALVATTDGEAEVRQVAGRFLKALQQPFPLEGVTANIGGSLGVALYPTHADSAAALMRAADHAMYAVKRAGKGAVGVYRAPEGDTGSPG